MKSRIWDIIRRDNFPTFVNKALYGDTMVVSVLINFHPWFKFYFPLFLGMVLYENVSITKGKYILQSKQFKCTPEDCTNE